MEILIMVLSLGHGVPVCVFHTQPQIKSSQVLYQMC